MTSLGIEAANFWLVAQCLNQLRHCVPPSLEYSEALFLYGSVFECLNTCVKCAVLTVVTEKVHVFGGATPCSLVFFSCAPLCIGNPSTLNK